MVHLLTEDIARHNSSAWADVPPGSVVITDFGYKLPRPISKPNGFRFHLLQNQLTETART